VAGAAKAAARKAGEAATTRTWVRGCGGAQTMAAASRRASRDGRAEVLRGQTLPRSF